MWFSLIAAAVVLAVPLAALADDAVPANPGLKWWKGNLHTHSLWSDGDDFPEMIAGWYRTHGYHFLALSDHNILSEGQKWMPLATVEKRGGPDAVRKYRERFGGDWVETRADPMDGAMTVRLKPLDEFRHIVEERGRFMLIPGEEISDKVGKLPLHLNATNLRDMILPLGGSTIREAMAADLRAAEEQAKKTGREILVHLNHPNFGWAVTAEDLAHVIQEQFFEVYNGHTGSGTWRTRCGWRSSARRRCSGWPPTTATTITTAASNGPAAAGSWSARDA
jgi:hypothetical protein